MGPRPCAEVLRDGRSFAVASGEFRLPSRKADSEAERKLASQLSRALATASEGEKKEYEALKEAQKEAETEPLLERLQGFLDTEGGRWPSRGRGASGPEEEQLAKTLSRHRKRGRLVAKEERAWKDVDEGYMRSLIAPDERRRRATLPA